MITKTFNAYNIRIRQSDRYVSLTDMAKATGKLVADWQRLKSTESYLETLSSIMGIPIIDLIESNVGNRGFESGTWGHPKVSLRFAQWCSDEFAVQVDCWLDELLTTGKVELKPTPALPPVDIRVVNFVQSLKDLEVDISNPRFSQAIKDLVMDKIIGVAQLPESKEIWVGVAERAEQLGYSVGLVTKVRSQLGKFVKACASDGSIPMKQESRLCNGTQRPVNLYLQCDELDSVICEFLDAKVLTAID